MPPKSTKKPSSSKKICVFCNLSDDNELKYGKIYEYDGIVTHYYCLLLSSNMQQRGRDEDGILGFLAVDIQKELKRGRRLICAYCKKNGATLGCCNRKCKKVFHYPCGIKENTLHQFYGQYKSFCVLHRPKQNITSKINIETPENPICYICYDNVHCENIYHTLWAPCCKKNAWFHRDCVQQLALSAGYFFKCPLCNNKKEFQKAMLESGIFVPSQDASWELVPNAFQELLYRHNKCDADKCICPNGREYASTNARWELILCRTCGSQGIHMGCGNLRWINPVWDCDECSSILNKNGTYHDSDHNSSASNDENSTRILNGSSRQVDDELSDSDVSVGTELPPNDIVSPFNNAPIQLRPGPRSAKLKQLKQQMEMRTNETTSNKSCMTELTDILNHQQAHQSIFDNIESYNPTDHIPSLNSATEISENAPSSEELPKIDDDVIILDSDDDVQLMNQQQISPIINETSAQNDNSDCTISYMNMKIFKVTSVSADEFANAPETSLSSIATCDTSSTTTETNPNAYFVKRKADSSEVVSMIVKRINDAIDSPNLITKRTRSDDDENCKILTQSTYEQTMPSSQPHSVLKGVTGSSYRDGVSLAQAAIVTFNGKEFVVPLENSTQSIAASSSTSESPIQSNSDGDAGNKSAEFMYHLDNNGSGNFVNTDEYTGRRCYTNNGAGQYAKINPINDESCSSGDSDSRNNRNRLMQKKVLLRDLKFYIYTNDTITMTYRDKLTMNIAVEAKRERKTVNNCSFFCIKDKSTWASRVRGLNTQQHCNNKANNFFCRCVKNKESIILERCDRASEIEDTLVLPKDSVHFVANGNINNSCKFQQKEAAKENLIPDTFEQLNNFNSDKLSCSEKNNRRLQYDNCNENNITTSRKYTNAITTTSIPGTSRDELKELSHSNVNRRHFTTNPNVNIFDNRKFINLRRVSLSSYSNRKDIRCCVSIDLNRIQSIIDKLPNFRIKKTNFNRYKSFDDLTIHSTIINKRIFFGALKRSKSEGNIPSMYSNNLSIDFDNCLSRIKLINLQRRQRGRKMKQIDKHDCVR